MEFQNFIHNEHVIALNVASFASTPDDELRDIVKQSNKDAEGVSEFHEEILSEGEACKNQSGEDEATDMDENAVDDDVKKSESL